LTSTWSKAIIEINKKTVGRKDLYRRVGNCPKVGLGTKGGGAKSISLTKPENINKGVV